MFKKKIKLPNALDPTAILDWSREAVLEAAGRPLQPEQRHDFAVRLVAERIDAALVWPPGPVGLIAEAVDGIAIRFLLGAMVRAAYGLLKNEGKVGKKRARKKKPAPSEEDAGKGRSEGPT